MFSIIIPLYNKEKSILYTLEKLFKQIFTHFELIIINDGSTDDSLKIVESIQDSRIKIYTKQNGGVSSARNYGIKQATHNYIAFLDADDYWEPGYLSAQKEFIDEFPQCAMWGQSWGYIKNGSKEEINHGLQHSFKGIVDNYWTIKKKSNLFWTSAVVVNKNVFDKIDMFDECLTHGEDLDVWFRIMLNFPVAFSNKTLAYYNQDDENRAMNQLPPLHRVLPAAIERYKEYREANIDFQRYFDRFCLSVMYPYLLKNQDKELIKEICNQIEFSKLPVRYRFQFTFPKLYQFIYNQLNS